MKILKTPAQLREWRQNLPHQTLGFVPTMGALHKGHMALVEEAKNQNNATLVSIFVNPTQFNDPKDLSAYPTSLEEDLAMLEEAGVTAVFTPNKKDLYPDDYHYKIEENELSHLMEGAHRPGHFTGVLTVVMKLLNLAQPTHAYFGEKDYQQFQLLKGMVDAFFMDIKLVGVPIVRAEDGLALSSRNALLTKEERKKAPCIYKALTSGKPEKEIVKNLENEGFRVDYIEKHSAFNRLFAAAFLDKVRLIDNVEIRSEE